MSENTIPKGVVRYCTECFRKKISDEKCIDLDYIWDIIHRSTYIVCYTKDCDNKATWVINQLHEGDIHIS